jgi:hypothetical protein
MRDCVDVMIRDAGIREVAKRSDIIVKGWVEEFFRVVVCRVFVLAFCEISYCVVLELFGIGRSINLSVESYQDVAHVDDLARVESVAKKSTVIFRRVVIFLLPVNE